MMEAFPRFYAVFKNPINIKTEQDFLTMKFWQFCFYNMGDDRQNILQVFMGEIMMVLESVALWGSHTTEEMQNLEILSRLSYEFENPLFNLTRNLYDSPFLDALSELKNKMALLNNDFFMNQLPDTYSQMYREVIPSLLKEYDKIQNLENGIIEPNFDLFLIMTDFIKAHSTDDLYMFKSKGVSNQIREISAFLFYDYLKRCLYLDIKHRPINSEEQLKTEKEMNEPNEKTITILLPKIKERIANDGITKLSKDQTVALIHYLRHHKVILSDEYLSKQSTAKAFKVLTGYSDNTMKDGLSKTKHDKDDLIATRKILQAIISLIDNDLK